VSVAAFDYESKLWGSAPVVARPWHLQGLKLRYCLEDLVDVRGTLVDIGCGGGGMARAIKRERPDLQVHGTDVSRTAIAQASSDAGGVTFEAAPAEQLPFADGSMNAVTMFDVLEHLPDTDAVLREVARVLKQGGLFHIVLPLEAQPGTLYRMIGTGTRWRGKERLAGHIQLFDEARFRREAASAGLPVQRVRWSFHPLFSIVDIGYYVVMGRAGKPGRSVEDQLSRPGAGAGALRWLKNGVSAAGWYESRMLRGVRGGAGHFTCRKA
jgi:SAM-dependent methyltransferase